MSNTEQGVDLEQHYKHCEEMVKGWDRMALLEGLYTTFKASQGKQTDNIRNAILAELANDDLVRRSRLSSNAH